MNSALYGYLRIFHAIATEGSIVGASKHLQISSPSVSTALKSLEQQLGLPLFHRTTRHIELTDAGKKLFDDTQQAMQRLSNAVDDVKQLQQAPSGNLRITLSRFAFGLIIQPYYAEFCRRYPHIQLEISINDATIDIIQQGFDFGIRFGDKLADNMIARCLLPSFKLGLYANADYLANHGTPNSLPELAQHRFISFRLKTANRVLPLVMMQDGHPLNIEMENGLITNDIDVVMDAIRQGIGIGQMFEPVIALQADKACFIPLLGDHWQSYPPVYLYYPKDSQKAKRIQVFVEFLQEKLGQVG
ncbi:LysR substrate-binding domain-containing protein [Neisseria yangbaofengii]|uniref:LysR substrate-binding domain-containing protein n=1 Tax=Neisseria yangbaofengii TaxID=2709396 RepID=UPI0013EB703B|nr:LysR substrate-binding domain-containing protein [Neisseria yangbaofengii]